MSHSYRLGGGEEGYSSGLRPDVLRPVGGAITGYDRSRSVSNGSPSHLSGAILDAIGRDKMVRRYTMLTRLRRAEFSENVLVLMPLWLFY
jgi:hypothetical protein